MKRFAIYTACIGEYDETHQPKAIGDQFDYFLFTDQLDNNQLVDDKDRVWKVVRIQVKDGLSPILMARYIKTHPHELLPQYDAWIWVDLNLIFVDSFFYNRFDEWYNGPNLLAVNPHSSTDDVYEHIYEMCCFGFENDITCLKTMRFLQKLNYPAHNGLSETGVLFRKNKPEIVSFNEQWWDCILNLSKRDQFTFNYLLYKNRILWEYILPLDEPAIVSSHLIYGNHTSKSKRKMVQMSFDENIRHKIRVRHPAIYVPFVEQYKRMSTHDDYQRRLKLWGWYRYSLFLLSPLFTYNLIKRKVKKLFSK